MTAADYAGIVTVITTLTSAICTVILLLRQGNDREVRTANKVDTDTKLEALHAQGNSNLETARILAEKLGVERGKVIGAAAERENPLQPVTPS